MAASGGLGGAPAGVGGATRIGPLGGDHIRVGDSSHLHNHALHRFRPGHGIYDGYLDCYGQYYLQPNYPWPNSCS